MKTAKQINYGDCIVCTKCGKQLTRRNDKILGHDCVELAPIILEARSKIAKQINDAQTGRIERLARWLRRYKLDATEGYDEDSIKPWKECDTKLYWIKDAKELLELMQNQWLPQPDSEGWWWYKYNEEVECILVSINVEWQDDWFCHRQHMKPSRYLKDMHKGLWQKAIVPKLSKE